MKAPGYVLLKLRYDGLASNCAFNFNLCRYSMASASLAAALFAVVPSISPAGSSWRAYVACACVFNALSVGGWNALDMYSAEAGAYTRSFLSST